MKEDKKRRKEDLEKYRRVKGVVKRMARETKKKRKRKSSRRGKME